MTGVERVQQLGLAQYDFAMPQAWFEESVAVSGVNPAGHVVWCYDSLDGAPSCTYGYPVALTERGRIVVGMMAQRRAA